MLAVFELSACLSLGTTDRVAPRNEVGLVCGRISLSSSALELSVKYTFVRLFYFRVLVS